MHPHHPRPATPLLQLLTLSLALLAACDAGPGAGGGGLDHPVGVPDLALHPAQDAAGGEADSAAPGPAPPAAADAAPADAASPGPVPPPPKLPHGRPLVVLAPSASTPDVSVTACSGLQGAIDARSGGGLIQIDDLSCSNNITIKVSGKNDGAPLVIRSKTRLGSTWTKGTWTITGSYLRVEGIHFTSGASVKLAAPSSRTRITRCRFSNMHGHACKQPYLLNVGACEHRFDHNRVEGGSGYQINCKYPSMYGHFDHNLFAAAGACSASSAISIYLWQEHPKSVQEPFFTVEHNLFDYPQEPGGMIETKCSENWIRHNTFKGSFGGVRLRHGLKSHVYGNFIFDGMGISVCGGGHRIYNNYLQGCKEGLRIQAGNVLPGQVPVGKVSVKGGLESPYEAVRSTTVANNTVITTGPGQQGVTVGFHWAMTTVVHEVMSTWFVNNLAFSPKGAGMLWDFEHQAGNTFDDNLYYGAPAEDPVSGLSGLDPQLTLTLGLYRPGAGSANVRDQGTAVSFVVDDMDGQPRSVTDIGSDEISAAVALQRPLTAADVGPSAPGGGP